MKKVKSLAAYFLFSPFVILMVSATCIAEEYNVTCEQIENHKAFFDDPRPIFKEWGHKKLLPSDVYTKMSYDVAAMKQAWAEVVGFKAPDVVGKIAPEINPGVYTYQDKEKFPGLKTLMIPLHYDTFFKPGGSPHAGNFPKIEIVPTRQYYYALPIAEATKKYMDKTRLNDRGYLIPESYEAGFPFPRPSGKFKGQQIMYNWEMRDTMWDNSTGLQHAMGFKKNLKNDFDSLANFWFLKLQGRVMTEPYGWYDERARKSGEIRALTFMNLAPRDFYGNILNSLCYMDADKFDQYQAYINVLRRIRKLSGTDLQDQAVGQDTILDDFEGFIESFLQNVIRGKSR